jgi:uncharacterized protein (TIGR02265 family)
MPPTSKAQGFNSFVRTVREEIGPEEWSKVVAELSPATKKLVDSPPMPTSWVNDDHWNELYAVLSRTTFKSTPERYTEIGRRQLHRDLSTLYKMLMHLASPETVVKKAATIYNTYTKNGRMAADMVGERHAEVKVSDVEDAPAGVWHNHIGSITGTLECAGAKNIRVTVKDGGGPANFCVYSVRWG